MKKIATKKGESRILPYTTNYILRQFYWERKKRIDIWREISDKCSYGYVKNVIRYPRSYVSQEDLDYIFKVYEDRLNNL